MQYSKLLEIVWLIATREAIAASWNEIQPSHFLMGILKLSEISPSEIVAQQNIDKDTIQEISNELNKLQQFFKKENISTTLLRRELRSKLGNGNEVYTGDVMHRSERCKKLFTKSEEFCKKGSKNSLDLMDLFIVFIEEIKPDLLRKKNEIVVPKELNQFSVPFDLKEKHYLTYAADLSYTDHPVRISLNKRLTQQSKGILIFFEESRDLYLHLSIVADRLREQSQINLNHLKTDKILSEYDCLELLELYSNIDKTILIFPAIDNDQELLFPMQALNRFMEQNNMPPKIIIPVNNKLQQWWYTQCPKSKLFLSPLICKETSFYENFSIDKV